MSKFLLQCAILFLVLTPLFGCGRSRHAPVPQVSPAPAVKSNPTRVLRRGNPGEPKSLDPQLVDDTFSFPIVRDLFEGLTAEDAAGNIEPGIARDWTVSKDGLTYDFHLRAEARWSNGDAISGAEFVAGLRRAVDPRTASVSAALLAVIENGADIIAGRKPPASLGVTARRPDEVEVRLQHPAPYVLQILAQPIAAPLRAGLFDGPYLLADRVPGAYTELARNPHYWRAAEVKVERVRYVTVESEAAELRQYAAGELEITSTIPMQDMQRVEAQFPAELQIAPILGTLYVALNMTAAPFDKAPGLRQALSMAVDRDLIAANIITSVEPAYSFVANGIHNYTPQVYSWSKLPRDEQIRQAQALYRAAGYSPSHPLRLRLYFNNNDTIRRGMIAVAGSWQQNLGVVAELRSDEFRVFLDGRRDRGRWDAVRLGWYADYDDGTSFLDVLGRSSSENDSGYRSQRFDDLLERARGEPQPALRRSILENAERDMLEDYPIIPVYFYTARRLVKLSVGGAAISPLNRTYSRYLYWKTAG